MNANQYGFAKDFEELLQNMDRLRAMKRFDIVLCVSPYLALAHLSNVLFHRFIEYVQFLHHFQLHLILQLIHFGIDTRQELTLQLHIQHVTNYVRKVIHYVLIKNLYDRIPKLTILTFAEKMIIIR